MYNGPVFESAPGWGGKLNIWFQKNSIFVIFMLILVLLLGIAITSGRIPDPANLIAQTSVPTSTQALDSNDAKEVTETIVKGDSYTSATRRILSKYVSISNKVLVPGQFIYSETILTQKIQNQRLDVGSTVSISNELLSETLDDFTYLSEYQKSRWTRLDRHLR